MTFDDIPGTADLNRALQAVERLLLSRGAGIQFTHRVTPFRDSSIRALKIAKVKSHGASKRLCWVVLYEDGDEVSISRPVLESPLKVRVQIARFVPEFYTRYMEKCIAMPGEAADAAEVLTCWLEATQADRRTEQT